MTLVDGICFFDIKKDEVLRRDIAAERKLSDIQKMLQAKKGYEYRKSPHPPNRIITIGDDIKDEADEIICNLLI
ncbi:MAG: hypothetical protein IPL35_09305 [Sphingobacteriales bacterium]|nr:hypothetical protein [Sphingobacteriales bacterium]